MRRFNLEIKPAIPINKRYRLQDFIDGLGFKIIGGGQMIDGSSCDITFTEATDLEEDE